MLVLVAVGWQPVSYALLRHLETRYPPTTPAADMQRYVGMVVLGGVGAERRAAAIELMRQHPDMHVVFTGRGAEVLPPGSRIAAQSAAPVLYASTSRNTYEDAIDSAALPGVDVAQPWLVVTSAWHMPRALATFHKAGWNVTPYPVDYSTGPRIPWTQYSLAEGAIRWRIALHEYVGIVAYGAAGRI
ncbi:YdcF family protein [Polaromonas sp. P1(28)-13]|nr:YdcF family protein [Polaromonas sp. P1(28)-13]